MIISKNKIATYILLLLLATFVVGCGGGPEPRRPVEVKSGSFFKASVERSKELLAKEEKKILEIIEKDSANEYVHSAAGSWFRLDVVNSEAQYNPRPDDLVVMTYNVIGLNTVSYTHLTLPT